MCPFSGETNRPGEGDDLDAPRAGGAESRSGLGSRSTRRVDVVDEEDGARSRPARRERTAKVAAAFADREASLARRRSGTFEEAHVRKAPALR